MIASLVFLAVLQASAPETRRLPVSEVAQAAPVVLAPKVLPAETADRVAGGWVRRWRGPGQVYRALFWERSMPHGERFCARPVHVVQLSNRDAPGHTAPPDTPLTLESLGEGVQYAPAYPLPATPERCAELKGYIAGPDGVVQAQLEMIDRLTLAMAAAGGHDPLPFRLTCTGEDAEACADPRQALAELPLDALLDVRRPHANELDRSERRPDGPRVYMEPRQDAPWEAARFGFDSSGRNHMSWTVVLQGADEVESVELRRTTIIRH
jgi:hypothetical protein